MPPLVLPRVIRRRRSLFQSLVVLLSLVCSVHASEEGIKVFDLPAGPAEKSLTLFSAQSGLPVLFPTEITKGIRTPAVQGQLAVRVALDRLLAGTGLVAVRDEKSGAFTVKKTSPPPHPTHAAERAEPAPSPAHPESSAASDPASSMKKPRTLIAAIAGWLTLSLPAHADGAENPETKPAKPDEALALSPFEVRTDQDSGYVATNTLAGSRLNTRLVDTPASISVMTRDFIDDIGAIGVTRAMEYALGAGNDIGGGASQVGASTGNGLIGNAYNLQIRGYRSATLTRNYFPTPLNADAFNIERIEVARGPNSLLFGIGGPGGIVNTAPKVADPNRTFGSVSVRTASWSSRRGTIDLNQRLFPGKLAARLNLLDQEADGYHDFETDNQRRAALALTWRPTSSTTVRFDGEFGHLHQNRVRPWGASDGYSKWFANGRRSFAFGTPESPAGNLANPPVTNDQNYSQVYTSAASGAPDNGLAARSDLDGIPGAEQRTANTGSYNYFLDGPLAGKVVYLGTRAQGARYYRTSTSYGNANGFNTPFPVTDESLYPRTGNIAGPGQFTETDYYTVGATLEQSIGKSLHLAATVNRTYSDFLNRTVLGFSGITLLYDATSTLPTFKNDFSYNATAGSPTTTGQGVGALNFAQSTPNPYLGQALISYNPSYSVQKNTLDDARVSASYDLDLGRAGQHSILAFCSRSETEQKVRSFVIGNVAPNRAALNQFTNVPTRVRHINVFSANLADRGIPDPWKDPAPASATLYGPTTDAFMPGFLLNGLSRSRVEIKSAAAALQSAFFSKSLVTTIGGRRDLVKVFNDGPVVRDAATQVVTGLTPATLAAVNQAGNTYSIGAVYHLPVLHGVSAFVNKSTNFKDQSGAQRFEDEALRPSREIGPLEGTGRDYGFKFDFLDGRINATATRFEVAQSNAAAGFDGAVTGYINAIWTTIQNNGPDTVQSDTQNPTGHHVGGSETRGQKSSGYELEVTANLTPEWRVSFNVSKSSNIVSGLGSNIAAYLDKNRAAWLAKSALNYNTSAAPNFLANSGGVNNIGALVVGLDGIVSSIKSGEGLTEVNIRPWNSNGFTAYRFSRGPLKNLTVGGGVNYRGKEVVGVKTPVSATAADQSVQVFMGNAYYLVNGMLAYDFRIHDKLTAKLQLNVENLLDNKELQVLASNYGTYTAALPSTGTVNKWYYHLEPRHYSLSLTIGF